MTEHCGIGAWNHNSRVIHTTSDTPGGEYTRKDVTWEVFSHEPEVVPGSNGEFIMYFTADLRSEHGDCKCCRPGGPCDGSTGPGDCSSLSSRGGSNSYMSYTTDPNGNWSTPQVLFPDYHGSDTNFGHHPAQRFTCWHVAELGGKGFHRTPCYRFGLEEFVNVCDAPVQAVP